MSRNFAPLLLLLLIAGPPLASSDGPVLTGDTGWQHLEDKDGVTLYSRTRVGAGFREFKGTGVIDMPPATVEKVLEDISAYPTFMPYVAEARVLSQDGDDLLTYQRLDVPLIADRDYTVKFQHGIAKDAAGAIIYRDTWQTANEAGPAAKLGTVRVKVNEGSWLLEPMGPDGATTQATYQIYTDSGGVLPAFLANKASQLIIPRLFDGVRKQAHDPKYQR